MSKSDDAKGAVLFREIERRVVWFGAFLVIRASTSGLAKSCAQAADESLAQYEDRFKQIAPDGSVSRY